MLDIRFYLCIDKDRREVERGFRLPKRLHVQKLCRLDSGGETNLKATFLATTLGLRRLFIRSNFCS